MPEGLDLTLYESLFRIRKSEEYIIKRYPEDKMKTPMHMSMGQEAIAVGVCEALRPNGRIFNSYRSHAAFLAQTADTDVFFAEMYGKVSGTACGKAGSMHLSHVEKGHICSSAIVGSSLPVALGYAFAAKQRKTGELTCAFFGDGAVDEGSFWESLNSACSMQLPLLMVCEDNGFAVHTTKAIRQGYSDLFDIIQQFDCVSVSLDTTDASEIYAATKNLAQSIKEKGKPAFLIAKCYRYLEHVGINYDFHDNYRPETEFEKWKRKDPVNTARSKLLASGASEGSILQLEAEIEEQIKASIQKAEVADPPSPAHLHKHIFA